MNFYHPDLQALFEANSARNQPNEKPITEDVVKAIRNANPNVGESPDIAAQPVTASAVPKSARAWVFPFWR